MALYKWACLLLFLLLLNTRIKLEIYSEYIYTLD